MFIEKDSIFISYPLTTGNPYELGLFESTRTRTSDVTFQSGKKYYVSMGKYILDAKYQFNKLWSSKTGRNLSGTFSGQFNGIYPKITMQFRRLNKSEVEFLSDILDTANQETIYYDPKKKAYITMETYCGDWELYNKSIINENKKADGFTWSVISKKKRA